MNKISDFLVMIAKLIYIIILMIYVKIIHKWQLKEGKSCLKLAIMTNRGCPAVKVLGFAVCNLNPYHKQVEEYSYRIATKYSLSEKYKKLSNLDFLKLALA